MQWNASALPGKDWTANAYASSIPPDLEMNELRTQQ
jgi:hypothetical protein